MTRCCPPGECEVFYTPIHRGADLLVRHRVVAAISKKKTPCHSSFGSSFIVVQVQVNAARGVDSHRVLAYEVCPSSKQERFTTTKSTRSAGLTCNACLISSTLWHLAAPGDKHSFYVKVYYPVIDNMIGETERQDKYQLQHHERCSGT